MQNLWSKTTVIHTIGKILVVLDHLHEVEMIWHREQWTQLLYPRRGGNNKTQVQDNMEVTTITQVGNLTRDGDQVRFIQFSDSSKFFLTNQMSAENELKDSDRLFTSLIRSIEERQAEVNAEIAAEQKAAESRSDELISELQGEIAELQRRNTELEELMNNEDHLNLLQVTANRKLRSVQELQPTLNSGYCPEVHPNQKHTQAYRTGLFKYKHIWPSNCPENLILVL